VLHKVPQHAQGTLNEPKLLSEPQLLTSSYLCCKCWLLPSVLLLLLLLPGLHVLLLLQALPSGTGSHVGVALPWRYLQLCWGCPCWVRLNLATTLPLALGLGLFVAGTGYKALGALSAARLADVKAISTGKKIN